MPKVNQNGPSVAGAPEDATAVNALGEVSYLNPTVQPDEDDPAPATSGAAEVEKPKRATRASDKTSNSGTNKIIKVG